MARWTTPTSPLPGLASGATCRPTPARRWPLLERSTGTSTWVKHENHNPTGAFKVRGGLNLAARMVETGERRGLISASRGNHSQSLAFAGAAYGVPVTVVVPEGNSADKNAATEAFGAELIVHGRDFQESLEHAMALAGERDLLAVPPFHPWLVEGVATYAAELHEAVPELDVVYVPVGMGSGICANIAVRDLLGLATEVVGVVARAGAGVRPVLRRRRGRRRPRAPTRSSTASPVVRRTRTPSPPSTRARRGSCRSPRSRRPRRWR